MKKNVAQMERIVSVVLGALALSQTFGPERSKVMRTAAGSVGLTLLWRGLTGNCPLYSQLDVSTESKARGKALGLASIKQENSALINKPLAEVQDFFRDAIVPFATFLRSEDEREFLAHCSGKSWRLILEEEISGTRTFIKVKPLDASEPKISQKLLRLLKVESTPVLDLRKLKSLIETGEIATIEGQPAGERGMFGKIIETVSDLLREKIEGKPGTDSQASMQTSGGFEQRKVVQA